jgi:hypothetical protein
METHPSGFKLPASAPEGHQQFSISRHEHCRLHLPRGPHFWNENKKLEPLVDLMTSQDKDSICDVNRQLAAVEIPNRI